MKKEATFIVSGYVERHYRLEIEASSYEEAEEAAERMLHNSEPAHLYDYDNGTCVIICDTECEDPDWEEDSESNWEEDSEEESHLRDLVRLREGRVR